MKLWGARFLGGHTSTTFSNTLVTTWADLSPALSTMRALLQHASVMAARPQRSPAISDSAPAPELPAQAAAPAEVVEQEMSSLDGSDSSNTALTGARVLSAAFALLIATLCLWQLIKWRKECRQRQQASGGAGSESVAREQLAARPATQAGTGKAGSVAGSEKILSSKW